VDREAILKHILNGYGRLAKGLLSPENWAYCSDVRSYAHDPARARALLDSAGLRPGRGGVRFGLVYKTSNNKVSRQIASAVQQQLRAVGVDVSVQWLEWGTFYRDVKRGDFDLFGLTWVGITDPDGLRLRFSSKAFPPEGFNRGLYRNAEVDRLLEEGARVSEPAARRAIYARAQALLAEDVPYVSLWHPDNVAVAQPGVTGVLLPPDGNFSFLATVVRETP
jgi:peptide/nickel transport system substrate-binding protein